MKVTAKYVAKPHLYQKGAKLHKIRLMAGGSPFISGHSYTTKASAVAAAKRLNERLKGKP